MILNIRDDLTMELAVSTLLSEEASRKSGLDSLGDVRMKRGRSIKQGDYRERSVKIRFERALEREVSTLP